jgi:hypothetical protein
MKNEQMGAIAEIKREFMERWGVDVKIELNIHRVDEETAKQIVSEYAGESYSFEGGDSKWISNYNNDDYIRKDYKITAFIKSEATV